MDHESFIENLCGFNMILLLILLIRDIFFN